MNKFSKVIILLSLIFTSNINASEKMDITIRNNTFSIESSCKLSKEIYGDDLTCQRKFELIFDSKFGLFEYYNDINHRNVKIATSLYNIIPYRAYANNKSILHVILNKSDIEKLFETKSAEIILSEDIFSEKVLSKERDRINDSKTSLYLPLLYELKPTISFSLDSSYLNTLLEESDKQYSICMQQKKEQEKPINRLKNYFGL